MDNLPRHAGTPVSDQPPEPESPAFQAPLSSSISRRRSGSGGSILSRFPFMRTSSDSRANSQESKLQPQQQTLSQQQAESPNNVAQASRIPPRALAAAISQQQHSGRKRKGSLRKVALLGRGAARDRREKEAEAARVAAAGAADRANKPQSPSSQTAVPIEVPASTVAAANRQIHGLGISGVQSGSPESTVLIKDALLASNGTSPAANADPQLLSPSRSPTLTTDDDDILSMPSRDQSSTHLSANPLASKSGAFFTKHTQQSSSSSSIQRRRSNRNTATTSPLSLQGLTTSPLPSQATIEEHDYSETEWWGWVILVVTWLVFVIGMGSCFNIWSWAWDVGTTPYAPPELEDDPTLPIVGYYPALLILTTIMAWVWVSVAWVGMKYFRHAKMSGD